MYNLRKTREEDVEKVMTIINKAKEFLKEQGVDQWQGGYPNPDVIIQDIKSNYGYVLEEDGEIVGTAALSFDGEPFYEEIHEGEWLTRDRFLVIHRVAVDYEKKGSGLAAKIFKAAEDIAIARGVHSIKIDTHEENKPMQKAVLKYGYKYCGIVYLADGKRLAYEKLI